MLAILLTFFLLDESVMAKDYCLELENISLGCVSNGPPPSGKCSSSFPISKDITCTYGKDFRALYSYSIYTICIMESVEVCDGTPTPDGEPSCRTVSRCSGEYQTKCSRSCTRCYDTIERHKIGKEAGCYICGHARNRPEGQPKRCPNEPTIKSYCPGETADLHLINEGSKTCSSVKEFSELSNEDKFLCALTVGNESTCSAGETTPVVNEPPEECPWQGDDPYVNGC